MFDLFSIVCPVRNSAPVLIPTGQLVRSLHKAQVAQHRADHARGKHGNAHKQRNDLGELQLYQQESGADTAEKDDDEDDDDEEDM